MKRQGTVILAAGDFPAKDSEGWKLLENAARVVCCDSAADAYTRRFRRAPAAVVGDLDSVKRFPENSEIIRVDEQETNDLEKALRLCRERGWKSPVVVGATGGRDDHFLSNVFRCLAYGVDLVTDAGRFTVVGGEGEQGARTLKTRKGAAVSVFATDPATRMNSVGLAWPLDEVKFVNLYCATLNRATAATVKLSADRPVYVFIER